MAEINLVSAKDLITERVRGLIHSGEVVAGQRVSIEEVAKRFGVSRTPVRDALWQLQIEGLVEVTPRVGVLVREISSAEVLEVYRIKGTLEPLMATWATERGSAEQREAFHRSVDLLFAAAADQDVAAYVAAVEERQRRLLAMAASPVLGELFAVIDGRVRLLRYRNLSQPGHLSVSANQHALIAEAVRDGDAVGAFHTMHFHMQDALARLRELLTP